MLHFFPTPYPEELWYSVLCRYHMRTGNAKHATTISELFDGKSHAAMGAFFPNGTIPSILSQLPEGLLDVKQVILKNTLFLYYFRMASLERKEEMLRDLCAGKAAPPTHIWKAENKGNMILRYCPVCQQEDMENYGETYWRTSHQLPIIAICPRHQCRLIEVPVGRRGSLNERFYLPSDYCVEADADYTLAPYESALGRTLYAYLTLPLTAGPTEGYNNLSQALSNRGYRTIMRRFNITLDSKSLYRDLCLHYGEELTALCFGKEAAAIIMARICSWTLLSPERYAMLAAMIGQRPEVTFGKTRIPDVMEEKMKELRSHGDIYRKKFVAQQVGVKTYQLDAVAQMFNMEPFWIDCRKKANDGDNARTEMIKAYLSKAEKAAIDEYLEIKSFANVADFIRYSLNLAMEQDMPKIRETGSSPSETGSRPLDTPPHGSQK